MGRTRRFEALLRFGHSQFWLILAFVADTIFLSLAYRFRPTRLLIVPVALAAVAAAIWWVWLVIRIWKATRLWKLSQVPAEDLLEEIISANWDSTREARRFEIDHLLQSAQLRHPEYEQFPVHFSVYCPDPLVRREWNSVLVYIHRSSAVDAIVAEAKRRFGDIPFAVETALGKMSIARGTTITAVPMFPDCLVNPTKASIQWLEDRHRLDFRVLPQPGLPRSTVDELVGTVSFYLGPVLIGEVAVQCSIDNTARAKQEPRVSRGTPYQSVFVSYAHEDEAIVKKLEAAAKAFGLIYLRDRSVLKSGEEWMPAIIGHINKADIFQLCWSTNAKRSKYVNKEWKHALGLKRRNFIRPVYWEKPMPRPPRALKQIEFTKMEW
jgi:hypothetical protein